jgi:hypothetical protein
MNFQSREDWHRMKKVTQFGMEVVVLLDLPLTQFMYYYIPMSIKYSKAKTLGFFAPHASQEPGSAKLRDL